MKKRVFCSFIAAAMLFCGLGSVESKASEWNQSSVQIEQTNHGWERMMEVQRERIDEMISEKRGNASSVQRHSVQLSSYQLQNGYSNDAAAASQKNVIHLDVNSELTDGMRKGKQTTMGLGTIEQRSSVINGAYLLQSQSSATAVYHFQASIEGGPSIQNQMLQTHVFQFSSVVER